MADPVGTRGAIRFRSGGIRASKMPISFLAIPSAAASA